MAPRRTPTVRPQLLSATGGGAAGVTIAAYAAFVGEIERGQYPACAPDLDAAVRYAVDCVCAALWRTHGERDQAQCLVARLLRLQYAAGGSAALDPAARSSGRRGDRRHDSDKRLTPEGA